jgi:hypothetical protein
MVLNSATLRRVEGNISLPVINMALALDASSWTWSFSATLAGSALPNIEPSVVGGPVEVIATINGADYHAYLEGITRNRSFGQSTISVTGRGINSLLDAPYASIQTFSNSAVRTAQQVMGDVLTINGVSMPWTINWGLSDWNIPANVFNHTGTYITALQSIAAAVGGYLQPVPSASAISVLPKYPIAPWQWATATVDYALPSDAVVNEGITWAEKARYNRVYVSGTTKGVRGQVTITGTDGALLAPMVNDVLITDAVAARQRGIAVLGDTGRIATVSLTLPVLPTTGIIPPGKFVSYTDAGVTRLGLTRSVNVNVDFPTIRQTIGVETHVS